MYRCGNIFWSKTFGLLFYSCVRGGTGIVVMFEQFILKRH
jgi:hypothetical protein